MNDKGITSGYDGRKKELPVKDMRNMPQLRNMTQLRNMAQLRMWHDTYDDKEYDGIVEDVAWHI